MNDPKRNGFKFFVLALIALAGFVVNHTDQAPTEVRQLASIKKGAEK